MPGTCGLVRMPFRIERRCIGVRNDPGVALQFGMRGIAIVHVSHPRFGDRSPEREDQTDGDESAQMHAESVWEIGPYRESETHS